MVAVVAISGVFPRPKIKEIISLFDCSNKKNEMKKNAIFKKMK